MKISVIILTYNHERYIQECLESVKYQIEKYNKDKQHTVQVIVGDDASTDRTKEKVEEWVEKNGTIFDGFIYLNDGCNVGTCRNYLNAVRHATGDYIKVIGGDDMFSPISLFEILNYLDEYDIVYGNPLIYVENGENKAGDLRREITRTHINNVEESRMGYYNRIHRDCFFNAPGTFVKKKWLLNHEVMAFIGQYKYVDDYTLWLKISELSDVKIYYMKEIVVIYRRAECSTYVVRNKELVQEIIRIYGYAADTARRWRDKVITKNNIYTMKKGNIGKYFNIHAYIRLYYWIKNRKKLVLDNEEEIQNCLQYIGQIKANVLL